MTEVTTTKIERRKAERLLLVSRLTEINVILGELKYEKRSLKRQEVLRERGQIEKRMVMINHEISQLYKELTPVMEAKAPWTVRKVAKGDGAKVTDHALVRWLQRRYNLDVEQMKEDMYREAMEAAKDDKNIGRTSNQFAARVTAEDGFSYVVDLENSVIVTCYYPEEKEDDDNVNIKGDEE